MVGFEKEDKEIGERMKTIVHILNTGSFSGAENVVVTLIRQMKKRYKDEYRMIYVSLKGSIEAKLIEENIEYCLLEKLSIGSIKGVIKEYNPNIIHAHDYRASMLSSVVHGNIPVICHLHNNQLALKRLGMKSILYFITTFQYKKILTVSEAVNKEYVFGRFVQEKVQMIGNPIDNEYILYKASLEDGEEYDVVFLGRLSEPKNPIRFINIMKKIVTSFPDVKVAMIGTGELEGECRKLIEELNLKKNVFLLGFRDNPYVILKNAKLLCVTSIWEGFGLMAIESLALGIPVISTGVGGLKNIVTDDCGHICENDEEFIYQIEKLLEDKIYQKKLSEGALKRSEELENIENYVRTIKIVYEDI